MYEYVTLDQVDSEGPTTAGIRTAITRQLIETWCVTQLHWIVYKTDNAPPLWDQVVRNICGYLLALWASGLLNGATSKEAFFVKCDQTTTTRDDIWEGNLIVLIGVAPLKPSEFVRYRIRVRLKSASNPFAKVSETC